MLTSDIVIVGAGTVGSVLARGLIQRTSYRVAVVEHKENDDNGTHPGFDARVIALAGRTVDELTKLGVALDNTVPAAIEHILVSDEGHIGQCRLHAKDYNAEAFGKVVSLQALGRVLTFPEDERLTLFCPDSVAAIERSPTGVTVTLDSEQVINAKLIIFADGGRSSLAQSLGFEKSVDGYGQTAIICNLDTNLPHQGWAHERFTPHGPLAFLPFHLTDNTRDSAGYSVVWSQPHDKVDTVMAMDDDAFIAELQQTIGFRHGVITHVGKRTAYPLALHRTARCFQHRAVVVGNAAQALHPIAGQGFNLGLRDAMDLVDLFAEDARIDPGEFELLYRYGQKRNQDKAITIGLTDTLVRVFSNERWPLVVGRNIGLLAMSKLKTVQRLFVKQTMGYAQVAKQIKKHG